MSLSLTTHLPLKRRKLSLKSSEGSGKKTKGIALSLIGDNSIQMQNKISRWTTKYKDPGLLRVEG